jgi:hypothetical protein
MDKNPSFYLKKIILENYLFNEEGARDLSNKEFLCDEPVNLVYQYQINQEILSLLKRYFSLAFIPKALYDIGHIIAAKMALLPSSSYFFNEYDEKHILEERSKIPADQNWIYKRFAVKCDEIVIDAVMAVKPQTLFNERWMLVSNGNNEFYEKKILTGFIQEFAAKINANIIFYNYPGVANSIGVPSRSCLNRSYRAMLKFLEDDVNGVGAKQIIGYGFSMGGGVQADALLDHDLKKNIKYLFIKDRTFSSLSLVTKYFKNTFLSILVNFMNWEMDCLLSSKLLDTNEIIIQTTNLASCQEIFNSQSICHDGIIASEASLAKTLFENRNKFKGKKVFIGVDGEHSTPYDTSLLIQKIESLLN